LAQSTFFDSEPSQKKKVLTKPLPELLRPLHLQDVIGQSHLLNEEGLLTLMVKHKSVHSFILWGPPGCGKTTIARLLADECQMYFVALSAVFSGTADLKRVFEEARKMQEMGKNTLLFIDEIHRFNKAQQDSFLGPLEEGLITLIGTTTENPSFELNNALLSRLSVLVLNRLMDEDLKKLYEKACAYYKTSPFLEPTCLENLIHMADGDGRYFLTLIEQIHAYHKVGIAIHKDNLGKLLQKRINLYDKNGEEHYNLISALHKSLRGSDPDAALYWFARMIEGGEDPRYISRRLIRFAAEDVGLASPQALNMAISADQAYERLGSPEGELAIAECVVYLATAPKSNSVYMAYKKAREAAKNTGSLKPPDHILNAPTKLMKDLNYGKDYIYDHDTEAGFSGQNYFPNEMERKTFYTPSKHGFEEQIKERLKQWNNLRHKKT
jgi:putative ATPase